MLRIDIIRLAHINGFHNGEHKTMWVSYDDLDKFAHAVIEFVKQELESAARREALEEALRIVSRAVNGRDAAFEIEALLDQPALSEPSGDAIDTSAGRVEKQGENRQDGDALPNVVQTAPAEIYLCLGDDDSVLLKEFGDLYEVSWSGHKSTAHTIKYVRTDVATVKESLTTGFGDALPELPEVFGIYDDQLCYTADQMHAHYRKGWDDALANWPSSQRDRIETLELEKRRLLEQLAQSAAAKDAARYRWLRDKGRYNDFAVQQYKPGWVTTLSANSLDHVIDAAMQGKQEGE